MSAKRGKGANGFCRVLFYAPLWLAYVYWRKGGEGGGCRGCGDLGERTPLMRESGKI
jgi:hypothetical protein